MVRAHANILHLLEDGRVSRRHVPITRERRPPKAMYVPDVWTRRKKKSTRRKAPPVAKILAKKAGVAAAAK